MTRIKGATSCGTRCCVEVGASKGMRDFFGSRLSERVGCSGSFGRGKTDGRFIMKPQSLLKILALFSVVAFALVVGRSRLLAESNPAGGLTPANKAFLANYENVRSALVADNLAGARQAAAKIVDQKAAEAIASAQSLDQARQAFGQLSKSAEKIVQGQSGYYVLQCPMFHVDGKDARWVQTSDKVSNPYMGQMSETCGSVVSHTADSAQSCGSCPM